MAQNRKFKEKGKTDSITRAHITLMMEAVSTSGMLGNLCQTTQCNIPEVSHLHVKIHTFSPQTVMGMKMVLSYKH
jgi:hypothetical protein